MSTVQPAALPRSTPLSLFDRKPFYTLLAATGFALIIGAGLVMLLMSALAGTLGQTGIFALFFFVPGLLGLFLSWKVGKGGFIVTVLLVLALLLMFAPMLTFTLAHPEAGSEFIMMALFLVGSVLAVIGGGISIVQWRRRSAKAGATPGQRLALKVTLGAIVAVALAALALSVMARTSLAADVRAGATVVGIKDFAFTVSSLPVKAGETVRLAVANDDTSLHTFTLVEAGIDVAIPPGAERLVEFQAPAAGTYTWYCVPHSGMTPEGRQGMVGTLVVEP
jgi:plastocyanin